MRSDLLVIEIGNGGDAILRGNDLVCTEGYENSPYLSMFGGDNTFWGNYDLQGSNRFQSLTENVLNITPLTSSGRLAIEDAIKTDLSYLNNITGTTWSVQTSIVAPQKLSIIITINGRVFNMEWQPDQLFLTYISPLSV